MLNCEDLGDYFSNYRWSIVSLGAMKAGESVDVTLELNEPSISLYNAYLYEENVDELTRWAVQLQNNETFLNKITSSHLKGSIKAENDGYLVFAIPYEKDWKIYVDGKKVDGEMVLDALMATYIYEGTHVIELKYVPRGLYVGILLGLASLAILFLDFKRIRSYWQK